jgi:hypothetical protein
MKPILTIFLLFFVGCQSTSPRPRPYIPEAPKVEKIFQGINRTRKSVEKISKHSDAIGKHNSTALELNRSAREDIAAALKLLPE